MSKDAYKEAHDAKADAEREFLEQGADEAKAIAAQPEPCPCCVAYGRTGKIWNAGAWMTCPMCHPSPADIERMTAALAQRTKDRIAACGKHPRPI
jgi:hypothetical protein